ncbi:hypothetical protein AN480_28290 (plasmid) [Mycobacterium intracellulare subsp. chimaera]|uniref:3'-5' exonuclease n=1 Tax=Mycobacterium intracellulare subsp. chimaera TaxID=222805 RepID=A0ABT7P5Z3_MYCIT|nr:3'-5' exonuclease [Mycobacterium intracellulare]AOS94944.1 hypothetical protein AN480_28290 [Mycobacterium intracellulare subsp. chimaera]MDM3928702.1 3'-5' exonuclease [Mycobacterium intracellulare subsp. chimaera]PBA69069.1 3'-5' exonuclease [Mycobacterium avium]
MGQGDVVAGTELAEEVSTAAQIRIRRAQAAVMFARRVLQDGAAVILDVETASLFGPICEIAIIDAASGAVAVNTLINPGVPIEPETFAVHGISDADVSAVGVPTWPEIWQQLLASVAGRVILAYNAAYDLQAVQADCRRYNLPNSWLTDQSNWADVMVPRSDHRYSPRLLRNGGAHRALGDVQQTRRHLLTMTQPAPWPPPGLECSVNARNPGRVRAVLRDSRQQD